MAAVLISNFVKTQQEEAARLEAYNAAVEFLEDKEYYKALSAFEKLGYYKDSRECAVILKNMKEGISSIDEQLAALDINSAFVQAIREFCEPYLPYCGEFKYGNRTIFSDFYPWSDEFCWKVEAPDGLFDVKYKGEVKSFFTDISEGSLRVGTGKDMYARTSWKPDSDTTIYGEVYFDSGNIHILIGEWLALDYYKRGELLGIFKDDIYYDQTYQKVS